MHNPPATDLMRYTPPPPRTALADVWGATASSVQSCHGSGELPSAVLALQSY